jgi:hypothetical protein
MRTKARLKKFDKDLNLHTSICTDCFNLAKDGTKIKLHKNLGVRAINPRNKNVEFINRTETTSRQKKIAATKKLQKRQDIEQYEYVSEPDEESDNESVKSSKSSQRNKPKANDNMKKMNFGSMKMSDFLDMQDYANKNGFGDGLAFGQSE